MKILMCNSFYYLRGGIERCFFDQIKLLEEHGHEVIPFSMMDERNRPSVYKGFFISNVDFSSQLNGNGSAWTKLRLAERVLYSREARNKIEALIQETQPDIAHVHGLAHEISPSILPAIKKAGVPIVQTLHDYKLLCPNTNFVCQGMICERCKGNRFYNVVRYRCKRGSLAASLLAGLETYLHKLLKIYEDNVDLFIAPSLFLQNKLAEFGIKNNVVHLPNFVDIEEFQPCFEPENYGIHYGRLVPIKGVETLVEAMRTINSSHLYIAGEGELEGPLRQYAKENEITNVTFLGFLNKPNLIPLIRRAAFTIVPSQWYENYSMTVLESFACGTPVIGSKIGGIPEQVKDEWNGLLFEPGNTQQLAQKVQLMLDNPRQTIEMGRNARRQVETINDPETHYQQIIEIYQNVLNGTTQKIS